MAKQVINVGTTANDKKGDSLRAAFQKVNTNFTELYTALGISEDTTLNLGAFEFTGSTMTTTDSSGITIDQATTITSDLTVGGDIVPSVANGVNLGSLSRPFKSLYVSTSTVYLGGVPLSLDGSNNLLVNNAPISSSIEYTSIPNAPTDVADLTDTTNLLSGGTGDYTFESSNLFSTGRIEITNGSTADEDWNAGIQIPERNAEGTLYIRNIGVEGNDLTLQTPHGTWTYGSDGTFNLPGMSGGIGSYIQATNDITLNANGTEYRFGVNGTIQALTGNDISIASGSNAGGTGARIKLYGAGGEGGDDNTSTTSGDIDIIAGVDGGDENDNNPNWGNIDVGNIRLKTSPYTGEAVNEWKFDKNGTLSLPSNLKIGPVSSVPTIYTSSGNLAIGANTDLILSALDGDYDWSFDSDGALTFPSGAGFGLGESGQLKVHDGNTISLDFRDQSGRGFYTNGDGFTLRSNGTYNWIFDQNGWLNIPSNAGLLGGIDRDIKIRARDHDPDGFAVMQEVLNSSDVVRGRTQLELNKFGVYFYDGSGVETAYSEFKPGWLGISGDIKGAFGGSTNLMVEGADNNTTVALKVVDNSSTVLSSVAVKNTSITLSTGAGANTLAFSSSGLTANTGLSIRTSSGIPNGVSNWQGQGGWNQGFYSGIATTGGTGTGLTVDVAAGGGGYINISAISIANPGTGYTDGDVITINNENDLPGQFTISVPTPVWGFGTDRNLTLPSGGEITFSDSTVQSTAFTGRANGIISTASTDLTIAPGYTVEFIGYIDNGGGESGATLHVTQVLKGSITNHLVIYGRGLPDGGAEVDFTQILPGQGSGGVGNYYLSGANYLTSSQRFYSGSATSRTWSLNTNGSLTFPDATVQTTAYTGIAAVATSSSTAASVGYIGMPQNSKSANYGLVIGDMGKHIYVTSTSTVTIPAYTSVNFPIGTTIAIIAGTGATVSIAITTDTMYLAGAGTTGTRTLAAYGMATLVKVAQSTWFISGSGLT